MMVRNPGNKDQEIRFAISSHNRNENQGKGREIKFYECGLILYSSAVPQDMKRGTGIYCESRNNESLLLVVRAGNRHKCFAVRNLPYEICGSCEVPHDHYTGINHATLAQTRSTT